jgi:hypothetical protein
MVYDGTRTMPLSRRHEMRQRSPEPRRLTTSAGSCPEDPEFTNRFGAPFGEAVTRPPAEHQEQGPRGKAGAQAGEQSSKEEAPPRKKRRPGAAPPPHKEKRDLRSAPPPGKKVGPDGRPPARAKMRIASARRVKPEGASRSTELPPSSSPVLSLAVNLPSREDRAVRGESTAQWLRNGQALWHWLRRSWSNMLLYAVGVAAGVALGFLVAYFM